MKSFPFVRTDRHARGKHPRADDRRRKTYRLCVEGLEERNLLSFLPPVNYDAPQMPVAVVVADFNNDGIPDLAVADRASNEVTIFLGKGDGSFVNFSWNGMHDPTSLVAGDFIANGNVDLAVTNGVDGAVSVLLGNGDGTFKTGGSFFTSIDPASVATADVNGDGKLDLVVANRGSGKVSVLLGNGDGTFGNAQNYGAGSKPTSVAIGDFTHDYKEHLVVANQASNDVSVFLGNGDGTFQNPVNYGVGEQPVSVALGDFEYGLKIAYIAVANKGSDSVCVLRSNGDGTFQQAVNYPTVKSPTSIALADFNGDGIPDLAVAGFNGGNAVVAVYLGQQDGSFATDATYTAIPASGNTQLAAADLNGDGYPDLVTANPDADTISVLLNDGVWGGGGPNGISPSGEGARPPEGTIREGSPGATAGDALSFYRPPGDCLPANRDVSAVQNLRRLNWPADRPGPLPIWSDGSASIDWFFSLLP
jgi:hypothetical protein